jgi:hypothetical protein
VHAAAVAARVSAAEVPIEEAEQLGVVIERGRHGDVEGLDRELAAVEPGADREPVIRGAAAVSAAWRAIAEAWYAPSRKPETE